VQRRETTFPFFTSIAHDIALYIKWSGCSNYLVERINSLKMEFQEWTEGLISDRMLSRDPSAKAGWHVPKLPACDLSS